MRSCHQPSHQLRAAECTALHNDNSKMPLQSNTHLKGGLRVFARGDSGDSGCCCHGGRSPQRCRSCLCRSGSHLCWGSPFQHPGRHHFHVVPACGGAEVVLRCNAKQWQSVHTLIAPLTALPRCCCTYPPAGARRKPKAGVLDLSSSIIKCFWPASAGFPMMFSLHITGATQQV